MSTNNQPSTNTFLAVFTGGKTSPQMTTWNALSDTEKQKKQQEGIAGWKAWCEKYAGEIVVMGGPLGKTKGITERGIEDISNHLCAYMVVRAASHEAAAKMFEKHPHFTIFPGESVEVMPVLPIPGAADACPTKPKEE
jgi:hypothetical protein